MRYLDVCYRPAGRVKRRLMEVTRSTDDTPTQIA